MLMPIYYIRKYMETKYQVLKCCFIDIEPILEKVQTFSNHDADLYKYFYSDETIFVTRAKKDKYPLDEFILHSYMSDENISYYRSLDIREVSKILFEESGYTKQGLLQPINIEDIKKILKSFFREEMYLELNLNLSNIIEAAYWGEYDSLDQEVLFIAEDKIYFLSRGLG